MFKKICPHCLMDSYSAAGRGSWICPYCSVDITDLKPETPGSEHDETAKNAQDMHDGINNNSPGETLETFMENGKPNFTDG